MFNRPLPSTEDKRRMIRLYGWYELSVQSCLVLVNEGQALEL